MLLNQATLAGIADGTVVAVFRRWNAPRVKAGSTFRTSIGVIAVERIEPVALASITDRSAADAGFPSRTALVEELAKHRDGQLYRISVRLAGPDPRVALRHASDLGELDAARIEQQLARLGARSGDGPWAIQVLRLIAARPAVRASDLAAAMGTTTAIFKPRVRQLKELGLTESLEIGYQLSPRGRALLRHIDTRAS